MYVFHRFELTQSTQDHLRTLPIQFGYDGFGELVYYRTYSRIKYDRDGEISRQEDWHDTVIRVVNGIFSIRKDYYIKNHIYWNESFWQEYAQGFAIYMHSMKMLPPGRGNWLCGTDYMYERGSMGLFNCAASFIESSTMDTDLAWIMDVLMCGVGVGFQAVRDDELKLFMPNNKYKEHYIIPDTREGWVESVRLLLHSYMIPKKKELYFDYTRIRPAGLPIKGFGGISSGPACLEILHDQIRHFCQMYIQHIKVNGVIYDSVMLKTDIANIVGCCVVAGNARRSAEINIFPFSDPIAKDLKDYSIFPYRSRHGWMSNDSAILSNDNDFDHLDEIANRVLDKGDPGIINLKNFPQARVGKGLTYYGIDSKELTIDLNNINVQRNDPLARFILKEDKATLINPCVVGTTWIMTRDGPRMIKDLVNKEIHQGKQYIYINNEIHETTDLGVFFQGKKNIYLLVTEEGHELRATSDHKVQVVFPQSSSEKVVWKEIKDLFPGQLVKLHNHREIYWDTSNLTKDTNDLEYTSLLDYVKFFINLFDCCGFVMRTSIRFDLRKYDIDEKIIQRMLLRLGINSKLCLDSEKNVKDLWIYGDNVTEFQRITMIQDIKLKEKAIYLNKFGPHEAFICQVKQVIALKYQEKVYDLQVPGKNCFSANGFMAHQCGEIPLENKELCNLAETCPTRCVNTTSDGNKIYDHATWLKACEYATFYCSTVNLLPTHQEETNKVIMRNRRIGVGIIDFTGWKKMVGVNKIIRYLREGYLKVREINRVVNNDVGIPESIRVTCVKPGGTIPKLIGKTSGAANPSHAYMIRRIRIQQNTLLNKLLHDANIPCEVDSYSMNTDVFEYPLCAIEQGSGVKSAMEVSLWEQAMNLILLQREWSDNSVANTLMYKPKWILKKIVNINVDKIDYLNSMLNIGGNTIMGDDFEIINFVIQSRDGVIYQDKFIKIMKEGNMIKEYHYNLQQEEDILEEVLSMVVPHIKSLTLLPHTMEGMYKQMPEEGITKEEYLKRKGEIKQIDWSKFDGSDGLDEKYCHGETCEIKS